MNLTVHLVMALTGTTPNPQPTPVSAGQPGAAAPADFWANLGPTGTTAVIVAALIAGYVASLYLHPNAKCNRCKGAGRHRGSVFSYATRPCSSCKGRGTHPRLGRKVLFKQPT